MWIKQLAVVYKDYKDRSWACWKLNFSVKIRLYFKWWKEEKNESALSLQESRGSRKVGAGIPRGRLVEL